MMQDGVGVVQAVILAMQEWGGVVKGESREVQGGGRGAHVWYGLVQGCCGFMQCGQVDPFLDYSDHFSRLSETHFKPGGPHVF